MTPDTVDAILKFKEPHDPEHLDPLRGLAAFALAEFGEGGNPDAVQIEDFIGFVNTTVNGDYVCVCIGKAYGMALEYIAANGGSPYADLVRVEWPELGPYPPIEWQEVVLHHETGLTVQVPDTYDQDGNVLTTKDATRKVRVGRVAS